MLGRRAVGCAVPQSRRSYVSIAELVAFVPVSWGCSDAHWGWPLLSGCFSHLRQHWETSKVLEWVLRGFCWRNIPEWETWYLESSFHLPNLLFSGRLPLQVPPHGQNSTLRVFSKGTTWQRSWKPIQAKQHGRQLWLPVLCSCKRSWKGLLLVSPIFWVGAE